MYTSYKYQHKSLTYIQKLNANSSIPLSKQISNSLSTFPCITALKTPSIMGKKTEYKIDDIHHQLHYIPQKTVFKGEDLYLRESFSM